MDDLHRRTIEAIPDAVVVADADGRIQIWNEGAERIFGFSEQDALGSSLDLIIPERQRERHWEGYRRVVATGKTHYGADRLLAVPALRVDGKRISIEFSLALLRDGAGRVEAVSAIVRDVTERWEKERARGRADAPKLQP